MNMEFIKCLVKYKTWLLKLKKNWPSFKSIYIKKIRTQVPYS